MTLSAARLTTEVLPEALAYACQSWVDHICTKNGFESREMEKLTVVFLRAHLLHWFEAMSLLKKSEEIAPMLQRVATWLEENTFEDKSLKDLVIEAINFARKFAAEIAEHPLYVYYTALPLLPSHSMLYQLFHDSLVDPSVRLASFMGGMITSIAFSTDGLRLVTGNFRLTVWDTAIGKELLQIPVSLPYSAVFSYDGSRIACGAIGSTVYAWDSVSGAQVIGPLSHSKSSGIVNAVAWSTDGERLISGCERGEVILWNAMVLTGNQSITKINHPGCSAEKPLRSVAFSSDGSQIASCSEQGDVYVWDSSTGGIVWSVPEPQGSDPGISVSFLSSNMGEFLVVKTKEGTQVRDASAGDLCPLPDSLAGAVGLTRGDFRPRVLRNDRDEYKGSILRITGDNAGLPHEPGCPPLPRQVPPLRWLLLLSPAPHEDTLYHPLAPGIVTMLQFRISSFATFNNIVLFALYAVVLCMLLRTMFKPSFSSQGHPRIYAPHYASNHLAFFQAEIHGFTHGLVKACITLDSETPLLSRLLQAKYSASESIPDCDIVSEVMPQMMAATDTATISLSYFLLEMSRSPDTAAKLQAELDASMPEPLAIPDIRVLQKLLHLSPSSQMVSECMVQSPVFRSASFLPTSRSSVSHEPSTSWTTHPHPAPSSSPRLGPYTCDPTVFPPPLTFRPDWWLSVIEDQLAQMQAHIMPFRMGSWLWGNGARDDDDTRRQL
ncbi:YVTN repeat-like/Quino protein amine dehydrogenase [Athelia psychrophila]|uniref:YVTN repeat-like/Quino protein amine dehydrogenase n=1 Tax=Athelia psychrophila TaxID=1759441 RepID=A0A166A9C2_9AGAM|nr:YVTN repeat-like/Quino protein amine dehydrogenase [Fibularhizoctonia sp. CBS 109695]